MTSTPLLRPLGLGEILDVGLKIVWRNAGTLFRTVVVVVLPVEIVSAIISLSATPDGVGYGRPTGFETSGSISQADIAAFVGGVSTAGVLGFLGSTLASGACFRAIASAYLGHRTGAGDSLRFALRRLPSLLWVTVLAAVVSFVGLILCVIPGVYLWVSFAVAVPVLMTEGVRGRRALGRSRELVRGFWWRVAGVTVLGYLLSAVIGGAIEGLVAGVAFAGSGSDSVTGAVLNVVGGTVSSTITTPFVAAFTTVLYFDLRVRKEAFDLQLLAERIGVEPPPGVTAVPEAPAPEAGEEPPFWPPPPGWKPGEPPQP